MRPFIVDAHPAIAPRRNHRRARGALVRCANRDVRRFRAVSMSPAIWCATIRRRKPCSSNGDDRSVEPHAFRLQRPSVVEPRCRRLRCSAWQCVRRIPRPLGRGGQESRHAPLPRQLGEHRRGRSPCAQHFVRATDFRMVVTKVVMTPLGALDGAAVFPGFRPTGRLGLLRRRQ